MDRKDLIISSVRDTLERNDIEIEDEAYFDVKCLMGKYLFMKDVFTNMLKIDKRSRFSDGRAESLKDLKENIKSVIKLKTHVAIQWGFIGVIVVGMVTMFFRHF